MPKPQVIWVVLEMIPDGNGLDDVMPFLFKTEQEAKKAADLIQGESDSDVEHFSVPLQTFADWKRDWDAAKGDESEDEEEA